MVAFTALPILMKFYLLFRTLLALGSEWLQETNPTQSAALRTQLERTWLHSAKVARKSGHTQQGEWALLGAGESNVFLLLPSSSPIHISLNGTFFVFSPFFPGSFLMFVFFLPLLVSFFGGRWEASLWEDYKWKSKEVI